MRFLADEGVDRPLVLRLRAQGYEVDYIADLAPGITDDEVLARANEAGALLLTCDKDFGELVYRRHLLHAGVVLLRLYGLPMATKIQIVLESLLEHGSEMLGAFSVITDKSLRIRRLG